MTIAIVIRIAKGITKTDMKVRDSNRGEMRALLEQIMILEKRVVEKLSKNSSFKEIKKV